MRMGKQRILRYSYTTLFVECWIFWANHLSLSSSPDHTPHSVGGLPAFYLVVLFFVPGAGIWAAPRPSLTKLLPSFCLEASVTGWMWWWHWLSQCHDTLVEMFQESDASELSARQTTSDFYDKNLQSCQPEVWLDSRGNVSSEVYQWDVALIQFSLRLFLQRSSLRAVLWAPQTFWFFDRI